MKIAAQRGLYQRYRKAFSSVAGVTLLAEPAQCQSNYWLQTLSLDPALASQRDHILQATNSEGVMTRPPWVLMHELAPFKECPRMDLAGAEALSRRLINIPSSSGLLKSH